MSNVPFIFSPGIPQKTLSLPTVAAKRTRGPSIRDYHISLILLEMMTGYRCAFTHLKNQASELALYSGVSSANSFVHLVLTVSAQVRAFPNISGLNWKQEAT